MTADEPDDRFLLYRPSQLLARFQPTGWRLSAAMGARIAARLGGQTALDHLSVLVTLASETDPVGRGDIERALAIGAHRAFYCREIAEWPVTEEEWKESWP